jgi:hypothetical protein
MAADIIEQAFQKDETKVTAAKDRFQRESGGLRDGLQPSASYRESSHLG